MRAIMLIFQGSGGSAESADVSLGSCACSSLLPSEPVYVCLCKTLQWVA